MRKLIKRFTHATYLHHIAAKVQESRRDLLRMTSSYQSVFRINDISFHIDNASRKPFKMFKEKDDDMVREMAVFRRLARDKHCFLDVGSHYGIFSLVFASLNPKGIAWAVEPSKKCSKVLQRNMALNPRLNIRHRPVAFGAAKGSIAMHYEWVHLIASQNGSSKDSFDVESTSLDAFIEKHGIIPDLIKIDVDGYEGPVIEGAREFLRSHAPLIFLELHGHWIERYGWSPEVLADQLQSLGFGFYDLSLKPIRQVRSEFEVFAKRLICIKAGMIR